MRHLKEEEIAVLMSQDNHAEDWNLVLVGEGFNPRHVLHNRFRGYVHMGVFEKSFFLPGGMHKHSGLYNTTLHNVEIGDNCCIENVKNYISNYKIGDDCFIENVDIMVTDGENTFGNGVEVSVMCETGGREVRIYDRLSAQEAYITALYRHRRDSIDKLSAMVDRYCDSVRSSVGEIGSGSTVADTGYIKNVKIGPCCKIEGTSRLKNGSINSNADAPVHIGVGVIADNFIISSGASVEDGVTLSRCFVGQACKLGHNYSASDSLFFANCHGENGEACALFAGPFTVTHHKSTLLIAGLFSFMNAGSGSNQSNHMYKLGPIHQGIMERGAKTASDSYILWPAKVGAFSLVMGRHVHHQDTSNLPFSYLIEQQGDSYIIPGANLRSVGTIRDARKWPRRDSRTDSDRIDCINFNLLSPYTIQKMLNACGILRSLREISGDDNTVYSYQNCKIKKTSLVKGLKYYSMAIDKFLGNSLISRIQASGARDIASLNEALLPSTTMGSGHWVDLGGMIAPRKAVEDILDDLESGAISDSCTLSARFHAIHDNYYEYEWTWASKVIQEYYGINPSETGIEQLCSLIEKWKESVVALDNLIYEDAQKEFSLSMMTSFGADGDRQRQEEDFIQVRGSSFESDPFVMSVKEHIATKSKLGDDVLAYLNGLNNPAGN